MTITSPAVIWSFKMALSASSSREKHLAVPLKLKPSLPVIFATAPSVARLPRKILRCESFFIGLSNVLMIAWELVYGLTFSKFSAKVLPVTVRQSPCNSPASSSIFISGNVPPISTNSLIMYLPDGLRSAITGTFLPMRVKSSILRLTSAALAMAIKCNTALLEPPSAIITVMAFSNAFMVMMSRGLMSLFNKLRTACPA